MQAPARLSSQARRSLVGGGRWRALGTAALIAAAPLLLLGGCHRAAPATSTVVHDHPSPLAGEAVAGVSDPALRQVLAEHWEMMMRWAPVYATTLGDHRFDSELPPRDLASIDRQRAERDVLLEKARAVPTATLNDVDRVTLSLLIEDLAANQAGDVCRFYEWSVGAGGLFDEMSFVSESHQVVTPDDARHLIARFKQGRRNIDDTMANLRIGLGKGRTAPAESVRRAIEQLDAVLAQPSASWAMSKPKWGEERAAGEAASAGVAAWPAGERATLLAELRDVIERELRPGFQSLRVMLQDEILPRARTQKEGLAGLPDTEACYRAQIVKHIGIARSPEELHQLGLSEIARTDRELAELGKKVLGAADLASTIKRLREDPKLYFSSGPELKAAAEQALARAKAAIPRFFGLLPKADCAVREIAAHEAPFSTVAYYRAPHYDGSKPGEYFVNTYKPEVRPRFELEALTWHESIPGHHLQIAIAQELGALPMFRKLDGSTAFIEGWALYTERLAEEMGLYTSDMDRLGKISYDAWRASRLVVDTGVHHLGWTRAQAEEFMRAHTALTFTNISNEVDRYIGWPGQALAYKVGQLEILRLRAKAEQALGAAFDVRAFHDVVLGAGAVSLPVLGARVDAWIAATSGSAPAGSR